MAHLSKVCTGCGQKKELSSFAANYAGRLGRTAKCRACLNEYLRAWRYRKKGKTPPETQSTFSVWTPTTETLMSPKVVAESIGVSVRTLQRLTRSGDFPAPRQLSKQRIGYLRADVSAWIASRPLAGV